MLVKLNGIFFHRMPCVGNFLLGEKSLVKSTPGPYTILDRLRCLKESSVSGGLNLTKLLTANLSISNNLKENWRLNQVLSFLCTPNVQFKLARRLNRPAQQGNDSRDIILIKFEY